MANPAFIVDGYTEKLVIEKLCPKSKITRTDLNGKSVTIKALAKKIFSLIKMLGNRHYPIIVVIDRENRPENCNELRDALTKLLGDMGLNNEDIRISFADRMFENWIIADWGVLECNKRKPDNTDGVNGSSEIKKALGSYNKTTDGVDLFCKCKYDIVYRESVSFREFVDSIRDLDCDALRSCDLGIIE